MRRTSRWVLLGILIATSAIGVAVPPPQVEAGDDPPVLVDLAPKHCIGPGVLLPPFTCAAVCPANGCTFRYCAENCDASVTCYYRCPAP